MGFSSAVTAALIGGGASVASTILGKVLAPKAPKTPEAAAPTPEPVNVMPDAKAPTVDAARKKAVAEQASRRGRASTILTEDNGSSDKLGG